MNYVYAIITAAIVSLSAYGLHCWSVNNLEAKFRADKLALTKSCDADKALTQKVSNDYQKKLTDLDRRYSSLVGMHADACIPITADAASGHTPAAHDAGLPGKNGLNASALYAFARDAEKVGRQLDACQFYLNEAEKAAAARK